MLCLKNGFCNSIHGYRISCFFILDFPSIRIFIILMCIPCDKYCTSSQHRLCKFHVSNQVCVLPHFNHYHRHHRRQVQPSRASSTKKCCPNITRPFPAMADSFRSAAADDCCP